MSWGTYSQVSRLGLCLQAMTRGIGFPGDAIGVVKSCTKLSPPFTAAGVLTHTGKRLPCNFSELPAGSDVQSAYYFNTLGLKPVLKNDTYSYTLSLVPDKPCTVVGAKYVVHHNRCLPRNTGYKAAEMWLTGQIVDRWGRVQHFNWGKRFGDMHGKNNRIREELFDMRFSDGREIHKAELQMRLYHGYEDFLHSQVGYNDSGILGTYTSGVGIDMARYHTMPYSSSDQVYNHVQKAFVDHDVPGTAPKTVPTYWIGGAPGTRAKVGSGGYNGYNGYRSFQNYKHEPEEPARYDNVVTEDIWKDVWGV